MRFLPLPLAIILLASCSTNKENLPPASGMPGNIFLIMDSLQWRGPLGRTLDSLFNADMPGLPRKEAIFKMRWINPKKFNFVLKQSRNLVFVMTLDQNTRGSQIVRKLFTPQSIEKIKITPNQFVTTDMNVFAKGQEVMYLYGKDQSTLIKNIRAGGTRLVDFFDQKERSRTTQTLFKSGQVKGISEVLGRDYKCDIKVPFGFKLAEKKSDFVWIRQINSRDDKDIFIARKAYTSQADFKKESLINFRDDICRKYLFEDPEQPDTYLLTETNVPFIPVIADTLNFNGHFAIRLRGIWRSNVFGMGGPFQGFALVDEGAQLFYYIEGFTYSPGKDQREIMRELETILYTFKTSAEILKK